MNETGESSILPCCLFFQTQSTGGVKSHELKINVLHVLAFILYKLITIYQSIRHSTLDVLAQQPSPLCDTTEDIKSVSIFLSTLISTRGLLNYDFLSKQTLSACGRERGGGSGLVLFSDDESLFFTYPNPFSASRPLSRSPTDTLPPVGMCVCVCVGVSVCV